MDAKGWVFLVLAFSLMASSCTLKSLSLSPDKGKGKVVVKSPSAPAKPSGAKAKKR